MGGGGKGGGTSGPPGFSKKITKEQWAVAKPVQAELGAQILEALRTGGVNARIPIIQRAIEAGRSALGRTTQATNETLSRANITGPFARNIQANQQQQGEFDISQVATQIIQQLMGQAQDFGYMSGSSVAGAASGVPRSSQKGGAGPLLSGFGSIIGATRGVPCWIALELYGYGDDFLCARYWIFGAWQGRAADSVRWSYLRYGRAVARLIHKHRWLRTVVRPFMDIAVRCGRRALCQ